MFDVPPTLQITNNEFITAIFGVDAPWCHVTDFPYPPEAIPKEQHLIAWKGDYYSRYNLTPNINQYFTISTFYADDTNTARRRKALYRQTHCIVLDDVKEKLSMVEVAKLPAPSWILETSQGSEQWGYILGAPCTDRGQVENLLDGLVANGLAPDGTDPGMKGVTRYVRLPEGSNNKQKRLINGLPFKCRITLWQPFNTVTMQQLAEPFAVNLDAPRRESRVDGAAAVSDHPLINIPDIVHIKEVRSDGRFDITCPWVEGHTGADDSGAAVFTNEDGSIGFKCHHGTCQDRTGRDLLRSIENSSPGFTADYTNWKLMREFDKVAPVDEVSFLVPATVPISFMDPAPAAESVITPIAPTAPAVDALQLMSDQLRRVNPSSPEARESAAALLKAVDELNAMDRSHWHETVRDAMGWNKSDFKDILADLRRSWYDGRAADAEFYTTVFFVIELNKFYDWKHRIMMTPEGFQNAHAHDDAEARKNALQNGLVTKVHRLDYAPKSPRVFVENGVVLGNMYCEAPIESYPGEVSRWLDHWDALGWEGSRKHMLQWMAYTIRYPENKINHMLLLGSGEGCGKDFLLYPLIKAMGHNSEVIAGEDLLSDHNEYLMSTKYVHVNEAELAERREAVAISNKLKPLASAPPDTLRVNPKGVTAISIRNIVNASMTTNSQTPLRLNGVSRRYYALWSDLKVRDENDEMTPAWYEYWEDRWVWMKNGGAEQCVHYLQHVVDLSDFNPAAAPKMTEFLRQIKDSSKSPMQQTVEAFIEHRIGCFASDIVTADDMNMTFKNLMGAGEQHMYCDPKYFSPVTIGRTLNEMDLPEQMLGSKFSVKTRLWVIRNLDKYRTMNRPERYQQYEIQIKAARDGLPLTIVK